MILVARCGAHPCKNGRRQNPFRVGVAAAPSEDKDKADLAACRTARPLHQILSFPPSVEAPKRPGPRGTFCAESPGLARSGD